MAVPFDALEREVSGDPFVVLENPPLSSVNRLPLMVSVPAWPVAMLEKSVTAAETVELIEFDQAGRKLAKIESGYTGAHEELPPDGGKLLSERADPRTSNIDICTMDLA
jgi:hypothetical protein